MREKGHPGCLHAIHLVCAVGLCGYAGAAAGANLLRLRSQELATGLGAGGGVGVGLAVAGALHLRRRGRVRREVAAPRAGTRAFEAYHTVALLEQLIASRREELARARDARARARAEWDLENLEAQLAEQRALLRANDLSPGRGTIGVRPYPAERPGPVGPPP